MQVECHYNGALGAGRELVESLMLGNMQMCEVTTSAFAGWTGEYSLLGIPYTIPSREVAYALWDSEVGDQMRQNVLDKTGVRTLIFFENGVRNITNNVRPITCARRHEGHQNQSYGKRRIHQDDGITRRTSYTDVRNRAVHSVTDTTP